MNCFGFGKKIPKNVLDKFQSLKTKKINSNANSVEDLPISHFIVENSDLMCHEEENFSSKVTESTPVECKQVAEQIEIEFNQTKLRLYLDQNINEIRDKIELFEDEHFLRDVSSFVEDINSGLGLSLAARFKTKNLKELDSSIKWQRTKVISPYLYRIFYILGNPGILLFENLRNKNFYSIKIINLRYGGYDAYIIVVIGSPTPLTKQQAILTNLIQLYRYYLNYFSNRTNLF